MPQHPRCFLETLPCHLPQATVPDDCDAQAVATAFAPNLRDLNEFHFAQDAMWRDSFALTGSLRTFYSVETLLPIWRDLVRKRKAHSFGTTPFIARVMRANENSAWVDAMFEFETAQQPASLCTLAVSLVPCPDGAWRIWVLGTLLEQLIGVGNVDRLATGNTHVGDGLSQAAEPSGNNHHFDCVIVGGGQAGLSTGGRCQALGLSYVILEANSEVGGNWRKRYDSAKLHTIREYSHLPFERTFGADYPEYLTKDDLANGYARWADKFSVNIWLSTWLESGDWDPDKCTWTLKIRRAEREITVRTANVVLAIGPGGQLPSMPTIPNRDRYQGIVQHSVNYTSARAWKGKRGLVVGIANTAHDVAEDMLSAGLSTVTMIQRSRTYVMPHEYFQKISKLSYNEHVPTEVADRAGYWVPFAVTRLLALGHLGKMASNEPERFDALESAGFKTERYGDIVHQLYEKMGRYYMDVGASEKIAKGLVSELKLQIWHGTLA